MKQVSKELNAVKKNIQSLTKRFEKLSEILGSKPKVKAAKTQKPAAKTAKRQPRKSGPKKSGNTSMFDSVLAAIVGNEGGAGMKDITGKTGLSDKQVANIIYKAKKQGKIKTVAKGKYTLA